MSVRSLGKTFKRATTFYRHCKSLRWTMSVRASRTQEQGAILYASVLWWQAIKVAHFGNVLPYTGIPMLYKELQTKSRDKNKDLGLGLRIAK